MTTKRELIRLLEAIDMPDDTQVRLHVLEPRLNQEVMDHKAEGSVYEVVPGSYNGKRVIYVNN